MSASSFGSSNDNFGGSQASADTPLKRHDSATISLVSQLKSVKAVMDQIARRQKKLFELVNRNDKTVQGVRDDVDQLRQSIKRVEATSKEQVASIRKELRDFHEQQQLSLIHI